MNRARNLWGEPVVIVGAITALLQFAFSYGWLSGIGIHGQGDLTVLVIVVNAAGGLVLAITTHRTVLAAVLALLQALANLGVIEGLHISTEQTGLLMTLVTSIFAVVHQSQTTPTPVTPAPAPVPAGP